MDDGKYWNHSETPNTGDAPEDVCGFADSESTYSTQDIQEGEQLLDDYGKYEYPQWILDLYREFNISLDYITIKSRE